MTYKATNVTKLKDRQSDYGPMIDYMLVFESGEAAQLSQKATTPAPKVGDVLEGTIEQSNFGPKFKKAKPAFGGNGKQDPETSKQIIRQNSLTNAVNYCTAKANLMDKKEALKFLTGKEIIQVATYFAKYSEGHITVVTESKQTAVKQVETDDEDPSDPNSDPTDKEIDMNEVFPPEE